MSETFLALTANLSHKVRRVVENGREWLVAPAVLINPGILAGSKGPLRYTAEDIRAAVNDWNGKPLTVRHPYDPITNENLSASAPGVWDRQGVGEVRVPRFNGKLRAEAWFDVERTRRIDKRILNSLENGRPVELSTGLYTDNEPAPHGSTHNGRLYTHYARNHRPDHLAILPDEKGACSISDGCGVLVNSNPEGHNQYSGGSSVGEITPLTDLKAGRGSVTGFPQASKQLLHQINTESRDEPVMSVGDIPLNRIVSTQENVEPEVIEHFIAHPPKADDLIAVTKFGDHYIMDDGHHRALARHYSGDTHIRAQVADITPEQRPSRQANPWLHANSSTTPSPKEEECGVLVNGLHDQSEVLNAFDPKHFGEGLKGAKNYQEWAKKYGDRDEKAEAKALVEKHSGGGSCQVGQTAARTGCTPAKGDTKAQSSAEARASSPIQGKALSADDADALVSKANLDIKTNEAVQTYVMMGIDANESLRRGKIPSVIKSDIKTLDEAIDKTSHLLTEPITVKRRVEDISFMGKPGSTFVDKAYTSTSLHEDPSAEYGEWSLHITVPKGSKGLPVNTDFGGDVGKSNEYILPRGSKFRVDSIDPKTKTAKLLVVNRSSPKEEGCGDGG